MNLRQDYQINLDKIDIFGQYNNFLIQYLNIFQNF